MAMNRNRRLPCGRDFDTVLDHTLDEMLDDHDTTCPHCSSVTTDLTPVRDAVALARSEPPRPPAGFVEAVMARIHAEGRNHPIQLPAEPPARLFIRDHAATTLLATAVDAIPGVTSLECRFLDPQNPTHIEIAIRVRYGTTAQDAAELVRRSVRQVAQRQLGLHLPTVNVRVEDIELDP